MEATVKGSVVLAGAGPGDMDLITVKLMKVLALAEVIITDRLVNPEIIKNYASQRAQIILTGKQGYNEKSTSQEDVTSIIIQNALMGKRVLRLKGGDVAFFSNVLDELNALIKNNIPFSIIPGITAASGFSAYAGVPLTARGFSNTVRFISYNPTATQDGSFGVSIRLQPLETIVCYMAAQNLKSLVEQCLMEESNPSIPLAIVEQATTVHQKVHISNIGNAVEQFSSINFSSPSLVIIGEVVSLHQSFRWFDAGKSGSVFPAL